MFIFEWLYEVFFSFSNVLLICFCCTVLALILSGVIGWKLQQGGYTLATGALCVGAHLLALTWEEVDFAKSVVYLGVTLCTCAFAYGLVLACVSVRVRVLQRRKQRANIERAVCYTLPARENEYVRNRLQTALQTETDKQEERLQISLTYACRTLLRLQNMKLCLTERLETEYLEKNLKQYKHKQTFTAEEVVFLNDTFSKLMKLSAKYGVVVKDL